MRALLPALALASLLLAPARLAAQDDAPLGDFIQQVAHLWDGGDAVALVALAADADQILLDTGSGTEAVEARHATAALRELFGERESVGVRPTRVTLAGGRPERGFGELSWSYRPRGGPVPQTRSVYVGTVRDAEGWRITELRIMP